MALSVRSLFLSLIFSQSICLCICVYLCLIIFLDWLVCLSVSLTRYLMVCVAILCNFNFLEHGNVLINWVSIKSGYLSVWEAFSSRDRNLINRWQGKKDEPHIASQRTWGFELALPSDNVCLCATSEVSLWNKCKNRGFQISCWWLFLLCFQGLDIIIVLVANRGGQPFPYESYYKF